MPATRSRPPLGVRMPVSILMVVDLPGAVRPDVADHLAARHGEGDAVDGPHLPPLARSKPGLPAHVEDLLDPVELR